MTAAEMCPTCEKNLATPPHACPYLEDVDNDPDTLCTCCSDCQGKCADEI